MTITGITAEFEPHLSQEIAFASKETTSRQKSSDFNCCPTI